MQRLKHLKSKILFNLKFFFIAFYYAFRHPRKFWHALSARGRKFAMRGLILLLIILIAVPASFWYQARHAKAAWWDESWAYRQKIQLTNSTGADLTDFQVSTTVDTASLITAGKMIASTCADMRFTNINGQVLPYWVEPNTCDTSSTKVWIRVPKIYTSGTGVYLYYGNPSATSQSSVPGTFIREVGSAAGYYDSSISASYPGSGTTWYDLSGNNRDFVHSASPSWSQANGFYFNNNGYFTGPVAGWPTGSSDRTILAKAKPTSGGSYLKHVFHYGWASENSSFGLVQNNFNSIGSHEWMIYPHAGSWVNDEEATVGVRLSNNSTKTFFKNGSSVGSDSSSTPNTSLVNDAQIGSRIGPTEFFYGYIKYVMVFSAALSDSEISDISNNVPYGTENYPGKVLVRKYASADPTTSASAEERGPGPVAYWKFDEGQGNTVKDSTASHQDGTIANATWKQETDCVSGKCLNFNTGGASYNMGDFDKMDGLQKITVSAWVNFASLTGGDRFFSKFGDNTHRVDFGVFDSNKRAGIFFRDGDGSDAYTNANFLDTNKWHHWEIVFDGSQSGNSNRLKFFYDGVQQTLNFDYTVPSALPTTSANLTGGGANFNGSVDELKIYSYARTGSQVAQDYNAGKAGLAANQGAAAAVGESPKWMTDGLVGHWKMDESSGTSVADASGNGNTGTLTNAQETGTSDGSGNSVTTMKDTDGSLSTADDSYNNMILHFNGACGSITDGTERTVTDYTGASKTFTVATLPSTPNSCVYEVRHQTGGKFGNGLAFDDTNDYVSVPDNANLRPNSLTVSLWVNSKSANSKTIINKKYSDHGSVYKIFQVGNYYEAYIVDQGGDFTYVFFGTIPANQWVHLVLTVEGKIVKTYQNGVFISSTSTLQTGGLYQGMTNNLYLGATDDSSGALNGTLDDVRVYNRALSPDEVKQLSEWGPGPVGWWKMDEGSGTTAYDSSGNGNNGTFNSPAPTWTNGKYGNGLSFSGASYSYIYSDSFDYGILNTGREKNSWTMSAWIKPNGTQAGGDRMIVGRGYCNSGLISDEDVFRFVVRTPDCRTNEVNLSYTPPDMTSWYHLEAVYAGGPMSFYVNGNLVGSGNFTSLMRTHEGGTNTIYIGGWGPFNFNGLMDDVRIYNYARNSKQVVEDMNAGHPVGGSPVGSPVGYWKMDEGQGGTAYDSSINHNNGNLGVGSSAPTWTNSGKFGRALSFDGTDDFIATGNSGGNVDSYLTVSSWIKTTATSGEIVNKDEGGTGSLQRVYQFRVNSQKLEFIVFKSSSDFDSVSSLTNVNDGNWHYVAGSWDGTSINVYIDGKLDNSKSYSGTISTGQSTPLLIGMHPYMYYNYFDGLIDEVKVYSSALTPDQIALDMNQGKVLQLGGETSATGATGQAAEYCVPGDATSCAGPVGEWKFDEGSGGSVNDTSGNGNNGTWSGTGTHWTADGKYNNAGSFNGSDDGVNAGSNASLNVETGNATWTTWIKPTNAQNSVDYKEVILDKEASTNGGIFLHIQNNRVHIYKGTGNDGGIIPINNGQWYFIAVTKIGLIETVYVNGVQDFQVTLSMGSPSSAGVPLGIGYDAYTSDRYFSGQIDQTRIFNYARTPAQIAWDYNRGKPVGWWKMDEGEGDKAYDSSGSGNTGTLTQMDPPNDWVDGKFGKALDFDGSNDFVNVGTSDVFNFSGTKPYSVSAWFKKTSSGDYDVIAGKWDNSGSQQWELLVDNFNKILFARGVGPWSLTSNTTVIDNTWYFVTGIYDGTNMSLYVNGNLEVGPSAFTGVGSSNTGVLIGASYSGGNPTGNLFRGIIDDVRVYNYALTAEQVKQVMNEGAAIRFGE